MRRISLNARGFTVIEVMIVLVIAAVILLIVFLAVPALQRNARNAQRNSEAGRLAAVMQEYASNGSALPTGGTIGGNQPVADTLKGMAGLKIFKSVQITSSAVNVSTGQPASTAEIAQIRTNRLCNDSGTEIAGASGNRYAIVYWLESGSGYTVTQCLQAI